LPLPELSGSVQGAPPAQKPSRCHSPRSGSAAEALPATSAHDTTATPPKQASLARKRVSRLSDFRVRTAAPQ
jgi:hypothetical protein